MLLTRLVKWLVRLPRHGVQLVSALLINSYFFAGTLKAIPCWGFNCYACPAASFACPIGSLQHFAIIRAIPFYVLGVIGLAGALWGRMSCGWLCPFGFLQDLLYKVRVRKWRLGIGRAGHLRYLMLIALVGIIPLLTREPWFCKLCPAGMLEGGIPVVLTQPSLREMVGALYALKFVILVAFLGWMLVTPRPFCRYICPLGAFWSPFNRHSVVRLEVDTQRCTRCQRCQRVCPADIPVYETPNAAACIRCLECVRQCPEGALHLEGES